MKFIVLSTLLLLAGCDSTKTQAEKTQALTDVNPETKVMKANLLDQGYLIGTIKEVKIGECSFIIVDEKSGVEFDPINLNEDTYKAFQKNNTKVYFKYLPLRMMNRCGNYQPIKLADCKAF